MTEQTKKPQVSLASLMTPSKTVGIDFPGHQGFVVDLCYLAREELIKLRKKCLSTKFNRSTPQPEESLDEDKFVELLKKPQSLAHFIFDQSSKSIKYNESSRSRKARKSMHKEGYAGLCETFLRPSLPPPPSLVFFIFCC